jgi:hypothetical protein
MSDAAPFDFAREIESHLIAEGTSRFTSWVTMGWTAPTDEDIKAEGVVDFLHKRARAHVRAVSPAARRYANAERAAGPVHWLLLRIVARPGARLLGKPRDTYYEIPRQWEFWGSAWFEVPAKRRGDYSEWTPEDPLFALEILSRTDFHPDRRPARRTEDELRGNADLSYLVDRAENVDSHWAAREHRSWLQGVRVTAKLDEEGRLERISAAPFPSEQGELLFVRHVGFHDFGTPLIVPTLPEAKQPKSRFSES